MTYNNVEGESVQVPVNIEWHMLDKSKFFFQGSVLFSGLSATLYPITVLKTRQQVAQSKVSCAQIAFSLIRHEGFRSLYRGFGTSWMGMIPGRALYMSVLEITKSNVGIINGSLGLKQPTADIVANVAGGASAALASQLVCTPVDVVSQRLMVQDRCNSSNLKASACLYANGIDAIRKIVLTDGVRGLYRGFGLSILTYAPSHAVWWASYSIAQRLIWNGVGCYKGKKCDESSAYVADVLRPDLRDVMAVQGASAAMAGGMSALITMPLDTIKTRLQVMDSDENGRRGPMFMQTMRKLVKEGGWMACFRGLGPRCASASMSATTWITTYEFLKRVSTKNPEVFIRPSMTA